MDPRRFIPPDTLPEAYDAQIEAYRRLDGKGRTAVVFRLNEIAQRSATAGIAGRHPDYDRERLRMALFRLRFGDDLARRVWPGRELVDP
ncbi:MAG: hypothetical protein HY509_01045 [Acidobacteria bacterium]|nr:hypothetical protein [Acidobacteriota bacterium]